MQCPVCANFIPEGEQSCPSCGRAVDEYLLHTRRLTEVPAAAERRRLPGAAPAPPRPDSLDGARFVSGDMLAGRYRIVGLLGRGGMGEVFRADDLKLKQAVALKFLPEALSSERSALERFHREVRVARQISHPNVCRVYDIGEVGGQHFLSMEYIKGEELASVLKRFGRLPADKATEIARQICAGLAAAHKQGVIHRDLKPANIMIDADGSARIMDFGLAALAEEVRGSEALAGTPAYMSPEQLAGRELTPRSDIYSLGLVLYELFTGRRAFEASGLSELIRLRRGDAAPAPPSRLIRDFEPLVERVILRCLEKDPGKRPESALAVAAALPGGDPLAAALAIGETPSPEMVAAAPEVGTLRPAVAVTCLAALLAGLALTLLLSGQSMLHRRVPLDKSPEVLRERAGELVKRLGSAAAPADDAHGFSLYSAYLRYVREHDRSPARWDRLSRERPSAVSFWYRQSPYYLVPQRRLGYQSVGLDDPPQLLSGMASVLLDPQGRLLRFEAVPPQVEEQLSSAGEPDWPTLFAEAGLDLAAFTPADSQWVPPVNSDTRRAWEGSYPGQVGSPIRVEAAGFRGRPVYFQIIEPWTTPERMRVGPAQLGYDASWAPNWAAQVFRISLLLAALTAGVLLARYNLRSGRGDRRGAFRLAVFAFAAGQLAWVIGFSHVPSQAEFDAFIRSTMAWSFNSLIFWLLYISLEPYVRRRWPHRVISWSRLLAGGWRDPLVGRDILVGGLCGVVSGLVIMLATAAPGWLGMPEPTPRIIILTRLLGMRSLIAGLLSQDMMLALTLGLGLLFLLLLLYIVLRREWLAVGALFLILAALFSALGDDFLIALPFGALGAVLTVFVLTRLGLLAMTSFLLFQSLSIEYPLTTDLAAWYAGGALFALAAAVALALYGFHTSLAGQPLFRGQLLDE